MLIRRNTKAFKTIQEIVTACGDRPDREALIRLYITRAGDTVHERISVEGIEGGSQLFYEMNYQAVLGNLQSPDHQLHESDDIPGIYFFHSSSNKVWDETPFEFDEDVRKKFASLPDLPNVRKKEKVEKFAFPAPKASGGGKRTPKREPEAKSPRKEKAREAKGTDAEKKGARVVALWPKQPEYHLKRDIHFTGLERLVFREPPMTKREVLDYYNNIAEHLLPYLKDRPQEIRLQRNASTTRESLTENSPEDIPVWLRTEEVRKSNRREEVLLCNDREHLLLYAQLGCVEFRAAHARVQSADSPDYFILVLESSDYDLTKVVDAALATKQILEGLRLPSLVKSDGISGLHIYVPLDAKDDFDTARRCAEYLGKLVRLKVPGLVALKGSDDHAYGKVSLDYSLNQPGRHILAPYSLVADTSAVVATPLLWDEIKDGLTMDAFTPETILSRLAGHGDLFRALFKKKVNAGSLLQRLEEGYGFLVPGS